MAHRATIEHIVAMVLRQNVVVRIAALATITEVLVVAN